MPSSHAASVFFFATAVAIYQPRVAAVIVWVYVRHRIDCVRLNVHVRLTHTPGSLSMLAPVDTLIDSTASRSWLRAACWGQLIAA